MKSDERMPMLKDEQLNGNYRTNSEYVEHQEMIESKDTSRVRQHSDIHKESGSFLNTQIASASPELRPTSTKSMNSSVSSSLSSTIQRKAPESPTRKEERKHANPPSVSSPRPITSCFEEKSEDFDAETVPLERSNSTHSSNRIFVQFKDVTIHEHNLIVGDNPACSSGCPISMGWSKLTERSLSIDEYEESRPPRRNRRQILIPKDVRHEMLTNEWAHSFTSLRIAIMDVEKERERRLKSQRVFQARILFRERVKKMANMISCRPV